jgi:hypothetical protein
MTSPPCEPRFATPRTPSRKTRGDEVARVAEALGVTLMWHQRLVADVALELLEDGTPAYREIIVTQPRQSGKSLEALTFILHRAVMWGSPQVIACTAQNGTAVKSKLMDDWLPEIQRNLVGQAIGRVHRAQGSEAI